MFHFALEIQQAEIWNGGFTATSGMTFSERRLDH
jgi:hypothetical protein